MTQLGYTLASEEHGPAELVTYAQRAERVGFDFLSASDHYHPWTAEQGNAPFVWNVLGAVAAATDGIDLGVGVTCPTMRIHPAIIAQAAATTQVMSTGEFYFGVGTGENLNEHVLGDRWPEHGVRLDMLEEAVDIMRSLWDGGQQSHHGEHFTVENARLFTLPDSSPPVIASAFGEIAARSVADWADGFWTVGPQGELLDAYREAGGEGPAFAQLSVCYAETEAEAVDTAIEQWPNTLLPGELAQELPTPAHVEQACQLVDREDMREAPLLTDPEPEAHIELIQETFDQGFDHVYVHQVGPDQAALFDCYESAVLPSF